MLAIPAYMYFHGCFSFPCPAFKFIHVPFFYKVILHIVAQIGNIVSKNGQVLITYSLGAAYDVTDLHYYTSCCLSLVCQFHFICSSHNQRLFFIVLLLHDINGVGVGVEEPTYFLF